MQSRTWFVSLAVTALAATAIAAVVLVCITADATPETVLMTDKQREAALLAAIAKDKARLASFRGAGGLRPNEERQRQHLQARISTSQANLAKVQAQEASAKRGTTARIEAQLRAANAASAARVANVNAALQKRDKQQYQKYVANTLVRIKQHDAAVKKAAADSVVDDSGIISSMQNAMTSNQQRIDTIEKNSLQRRMAAMKHRQAMGQRRRAALHRAVIASRGPAGFSPAEAAAVAKMRSAIQQDAANVASARTLRDNEGAAVEANLLTANKKNLACLQSKGYLSGACP